MQRRETLRRCARRLEIDPPARHARVPPLARALSGDKIRFRGREPNPTSARRIPDPSTGACASRYRSARRLKRRGCAVSLRAHTGRPVNRAACQGMGERTSGRWPSRKARVAASFRPRTARRSIACQRPGPKAHPSGPGARAHQPLRNAFTTRPPTYRPASGARRRPQLPSSRPSGHGAGGRRDHAHRRRGPVDCERHQSLAEGESAGPRPRAGSETQPSGLPEDAARRTRTGNYIRGSHAPFPEFIVKSSCLRHLRTLPYVQSGVRADSAAACSAKAGHDSEG